MRRQQHDARWKVRKKPTVIAWTTEYVGGKPQKTKAEFRAYEDYTESLWDHQSFLLQNRRYKAAVFDTIKVIHLGVFDR